MLTSIRLAFRVLLAVALAGASPAWAQRAYPTKPILLVVPLAAASAVDNAARIVAQRMSQNMGQSFVVENQPGAAGLIGAERVAKAAPDGRLNDEVVKALADPDVRERLNAQGLTVCGTSPEELATATRAQLAKYARVMKEANIKND